MGGSRFRQEVRKIKMQVEGDCPPLKNNQTLNANDNSIVSFAQAA